MFLNLLFYATSYGADSYFEWSGLLAVVSVYVMGNAISLPVMFKAGVEKARYVTIFILLLMSGVIVAYVRLGGSMGLSADKLEEYGGGIFRCFSSRPQRCPLSYPILYL